MTDSARRALVFTGHRIDAPERPDSRFPASAEGRARGLIRAALAAEAVRPGPPLVGLAGAASGGDILFHEVCDELEVPTEVHLAKPPAEYVESSVAEAGPDWIARFAALTGSRPVHVQPPNQGDPAMSVWERGNLALLQAAGDKAGADITLLALWNGAGGDGPGGTADMVRRVREAGGRAIILDAGKLLAD